MRGGGAQVKLLLLMLVGAAILGGLATLLIFWLLGLFQPAPAEPPLPPYESVEKRQRRLEELNEELTKNLR